MHVFCLFEPLLRSSMVVISALRVLIRDVLVSYGQFLGTFWPESIAPLQVVLMRILEV